MPSDEQQIRELVSTWMDASTSGDVDKVLSLMTDDVVFLLPGQPPMTKEKFAAQSRAQAAGAAPKFEGKSEIREIQVLGDWAFLWSHLTVTVTPPGAAESMTRTGHTLTIFRKDNGRWLLARDANLLAPVQK
jgi:uncharacterized protein (TIGR02246 family)